MTISHGFRRLAATIEELETSGFEILDVATSDDEPDRRLTVDLTLAVPLDEEADATRRSVPDGEGDAAESQDDTGTEEAVRKSTAAREQVLDPLPVKDDVANGASVSTEEGTANPKGAETVSTTSPANSQADDSPGAESDVSDGATESAAVSCPVGDCDATFDSEHGMKIHRTKVHRHEDDQDGDEVPAYRDPARLRAVYDDCDSFTEMKEALETDVSAQTVRRQMIAHDIYEPGERDAGSGGDDQSDGSQDGHAGADDDLASEDDGVDEVTDEDRADEASANEPDEAAIELPEGVTVADLKTAVVESKTLYDVQQHFDLDRDEAMELLDKYDLLNVVHGRVSDRDARKEVDEDEITRRILEHVPSGQAPSA